MVKTYEERTLTELKKLVKERGIETRAETKPGLIRALRRNRLFKNLKKGSLSQYGYSTHESAKSRRKALESAIDEYGPLSVLRKLNAVAILNKSQSPGSSRVFKNDMHWVQKNYFK